MSSLPGVDDVLDDLLELAPCDLAARFRLARLGGGWVHEGVAASGPETEASRAWREGDGVRVLAAWDPELPPTRAINRFVAVDPRASGAEPFQRYYGSFGLEREARMLVYDDDRFVAWLGVVRRSSPWTARQLRRLNDAAGRLRRRLVARDRAERHARPTATLLFDREGRLRAAADDWSGSEQALVAFGRAVRDIVTNDRPTTTLAAGHLLVTKRMGGCDGERFLVEVRPPARPRAREAAWLSPRQRAIAELAASGATVADMAAHLALRKETVRAHLRRVYARLEVSSRLELAQRLAS